jgi:hypothetical protein
MFSHWLIVSKQTPSKSEKGKAKHTPVVMNGLAATLGVKAANLNTGPLMSSVSSVSRTAFHRAPDEINGNQSGGD